MTRRQPSSTLFPYTTLFRSSRSAAASYSRPRTKRGPSAYGAACLDTARGNSVPPSCSSADISTNTNGSATPPRSEEHTSELQSQSNLVCRLLLEKKKKKIKN